MVLTVPAQPVACPKPLITIKTTNADKPLATPKTRLASNEAPIPTSSSLRASKRVPALPATNCPAA